VNHSKNILIFGAHSDIGVYLIPLLNKLGFSTYCFTRQPLSHKENSHIIWLRNSDFGRPSSLEGVEIPTVISLMPIWELSKHRNILESIQAAKLIAFSSTSITSKARSSSARERHVSELLQQGESWIQNEFINDSRSALILRPTMIYGGKYNLNINRIIRIVKLLRFFLLIGHGTGLRQPVHAEDLAKLCCQCLENQNSGNRTFIVAGGEILQYRNMIERIFESVGISTRIISVPIFLAKPILSVLKCFPSHRDITLEMLKRIDQNLCYNHQEAINELGWSPRGFQP